MFRIYYDGGATYAGDPYAAPAFGVLVIVETDAEHGRRIIQNADYYCWRDGQWYEADFVGLIDYLAQPGPKKVVFGRLVANEAHQAAFDLAYSDPDFAPKTGWSPRHHGGRA